MAPAAGVSSLRFSLLRAAVSGPGGLPARILSAPAGFHTSSNSNSSAAAVARRSSYACFRTISSSSAAAARGSSGGGYTCGSEQLRLGVKGRSIFSGGCAFLKERVGRLYDSFFYSQGSTKYVMLLLFPAAIFYTRFRADTKLGYYVFINEESIYPDYEGNYLETKWKNGRKFYVEDNVTVQQFKQQVYDSSRSSERKRAPPDNVKASCRGRVFEDADNLALAVRAFCRRDPRILFFQDDL